MAPTTARLVLYFVLDSSALRPQQHNGLHEHGSQARRQVAFLYRPVPPRPGAQQAAAESQEQGFQPAARSALGLNRASHQFPGIVRSK